MSIDLDPRTLCVTGVTHHQDMPFDVPLITEITDDLWVGGCTSGLMLPAEVEHVVSLYSAERYRPNPEGHVKSFLQVEMQDSRDDLDEDLIWSVTEWVNGRRRDGLTLVHCQMGLNRSCLVAATALAFGWSFGPAYPAIEALALLRGKRSPAVLCNPLFEEFLLGLDER